VASAVVHLPDAGLPYGPKASPLCPSVVWVESGTTVYALPFPTASAEFIAPAGVNSFVVRVVATLTDGRVQAFDREVAVLGLSTGLRKPIPRESNEFAVRGPLDVVAKLAGLVETGGGGGGPPLSDADPLADAAADPGVSSDASRADHVHPESITRSDADPLADAPTADPGVSSEVSRADHVHPEAASTSALSRIVAVAPTLPATADSFQTWADMWTAIGGGADAREIILQHSSDLVTVPSGVYNFQGTRSIRGGFIGASGQKTILQCDAGAAFQNLHTIGPGLIIRGSSNASPVIDLFATGQEETITIEGSRIFTFANPGPFILVRPQINIPRIQLLGQGSALEGIILARAVVMDPAAALIVDLLGNNNYLGAGGAITVGAGGSLVVNCLGPGCDVQINAIGAPVGSTVTIRASRIAARTALTNVHGTILGTLIYEMVDDPAASALTANPAQLQGNGYSFADVNEFSVVAAPGDATTLATAIPGWAQTIINHGANTMQVFPQFGDDLGFGVNVSTTQAPGVTNRYLCYKAGFLKKL